MREYFKKSKWKLIQLAFLSIVVLLTAAYIHGRSVYHQKIAELEQAKQTFGK